MERVLIDLANEKGLYIEGAVLKLIKADTPEMKDYLSKAIELYKGKIRDNNKFQDVAAKLERLNDELNESLKAEKEAKRIAEIERVKAETAKDEALNDLEIVKARTQQELMISSTNKNYYLIGGVFVSFVLIYIVLIVSHHADSAVFANNLGNLGSILFSSAFALISYSLGQKQAQENSKKQ